MSCLRTLLARGPLHSPKRCLDPESRYSNGTGLCWTVNRRQYHDESFGFRKRREYVFPDCELGSFVIMDVIFILLYLDTPNQLQNRAENARLLRYVDAMRTHGHRAARIDPLDLGESEQ